MALKTRLEILEKDHDSAVEQNIENEINLISLQRRAEKLQPGKDYDELQVAIDTKKKNMATVQSIVEIIEELIKKEKEAK